ncbi:hypothetical protein MPC4_80123 [Methylocella tundrae]|uniref:Uncharacterized protein n=1 Tax=Methylocella tundrae TaxID=227605 RepID=A0A8B6MC02_METTU|nr:hypothetical protein MPC1_1810005 [Methylocella tundrae]VTZ52452.1 hypothetical protein MPC4_80123 [Methylocella tundrae]
MCRWLARQAPYSRPTGFHTCLCAQTELNLGALLESKRPKRTGTGDPSIFKINPRHLIRDYEPRAVPIIVPLFMCAKDRSSVLIWTLGIAVTKRPKVTG